MLPRGERVSLRRQLAIVALVYVIEGFPVGVHNVWPVFFRRQDASLGEIGWLSVLGFAWSFKVLWSPLVDRFGERRGWIAACLAAMAASQLALAAVADGGVGPAVWVALALFCLASATQDIAIDAYTIGFVERGREGLANSVRITAYRAGLLAASGLLLLPRWIGWPGAFATAAIALLVLAAAVLRCPSVPVPEAARRELLPSLARWLARGGAGAVAAFVLLYRVGDRAMGPMPAALWVDRGFSNEEIALLSTTFGMLATIAGAVCGGAVVTRIGIGRALGVLGAARARLEPRLRRRRARRGQGTGGRGGAGRVLLWRARDRGLPLVSDADLREGARRGAVRAALLAGPAGRDGGRRAVGRDHRADRLRGVLRAHRRARAARLRVPAARERLARRGSPAHSRQSAGTPARSASIVSSRRFFSLRVRSSRCRRSSCLSW